MSLGRRCPGVAQARKDIVGDIKKNIWDNLLQIWLVLKVGRDLKTPENPETMCSI